MQLQYAGPRPTISHLGVTFKDGKDDKYVYLEFAIDILESMDEDYKNTGYYSHIVKEHKLSDKEMQDIISKYHPSLQNEMMHEIKHYDQHIKNEIILAKTSTRLKEFEQEILIKNLEIMHDYRIQRAKNKIFYHHIIQTIIETIINKNIKEIDTPFNEKFWHILQTIEGEIAKNKITLFTNLKIEKVDNILYAKLIINK